MEPQWVFVSTDDDTLNSLGEEHRDHHLSAAKAGRIQHYFDGNWEEALSACNDIIEKYGGICGDYVIRANTLLKMNEWKRAAEDCEIAIEKNPSSSPAYCTRGLTYRSMGRLDEAEADYNEALLLNPEDIVIYSNRSAIYRQRSQWRKVIDDCSEIINRKEDACAYTMRGAAYGKLRELETAVNDCERAVQLAPKDSTNHANLALVYSMMSKWDKAIGECTLAINYGRLSASILTPRAIAYGKLRRFELALADLNLAISLEPTHLNAWSNRVVIFTKLGRWQEVISDCSKIIAIDPENLQAYNSRGVAFHMIGDNLLAERDLTFVVENENNNMISKGRALGARAAVFCAINKWKLAVEDCQRARVLDPHGSARYKHIQQAARVAAERAEKDAEEKAQSIMEELLREEASEKLRVNEQKQKKKRKTQKKKKRELSNSRHVPVAGKRVQLCVSAESDDINQSIGFDNDLGIVEYRGVNEKSPELESLKRYLQEGNSTAEREFTEHIARKANLSKIRSLEKIDQNCKSQHDNFVGDIISGTMKLSCVDNVIENTEDLIIGTNDINVTHSVSIYHPTIPHTNAANVIESPDISKHDDKNSLSIVDMLLYFLPTFPMFHVNENSSSSSKTNQVNTNNSVSSDRSKLDHRKCGITNYSADLRADDSSSGGSAHFEDSIMGGKKNIFSHTDTDNVDEMIPLSSKPSFHTSRYFDTNAPKKSDLISIGKLAFSLAHIIGRGSFGTVVYAGAHVEFGRAAIKAISKEGVPKNINI